MWLYAGDYELPFRSGSFSIGLNPGAVNAEYLKRQHGTKQASHSLKDPCMNTSVMTGQEIHLRRERSLKHRQNMRGTILTLAQDL